MYLLFLDWHNSSVVRLQLIFKDFFFFFLQIDVKNYISLKSCSGLDFVDMHDNKRYLKVDWMLAIQSFISKYNVC